MFPNKQILCPVILWPVEKELSHLVLLTIWDSGRVVHGLGSC